MHTRRTAGGLPGTRWARLKDSFLLVGALVRRGIAIAGLRSLDYAFQRNRTQKLSRPLRVLVSLGYWMIGGATNTTNWNKPGVPTKPSSELP